MSTQQTREEPRVGSVDASFERTRDVLHRVAARVFGRRGSAATGHFALRLSLGGIATPSFGYDAECVRIARGLLVRESAGVATVTPIYDLGWRVLDTVLGALQTSAHPAQIQLWPENFDVGTHVGLPDGQRVNLGCSPGDPHQLEPYLYVGPWGTDRTGDPSDWNAPFGAVLRSSDLISSANPLDSGVHFMRTSIEALSTKAKAN
jgi:hypothetical protein